MHELAEHLKAERLKRGVSVESISEKTRISAQMIEALEAGEFDRIGIPLIIRSFIRSYCDALGLESTPLIEKYEKQIVSYDRQDSGLRKFGEWCRSFRKTSRSRALLIILLVFLAVGTLIGGAWFSLWLKRQQAAEKTSGVYPTQELPSDLIAPQGGALASVDGLDGLGGTPQRQSSGAEGGQRGGAVARSSGHEPQSPLGIPCKPISETPSASEVLPVDAEDSLDGPKRPHVLTLEAVRKARVTLKIDDHATAAFTLKAGDRKELEVSRVVDIEMGDGKALRVKWDGEAIANSASRLRLPLAVKGEGKKP